MKFIWFYSLSICPQYFFPGITICQLENIYQPCMNGNTGCNNIGFYNFNMCLLVAEVY